MTVLVTDPELSSRLIAERQRCDGDRFDEVWGGLYVMAPLTNNDHGEIQANFCAAIIDALGWDSGAKIAPGVNVSDRDEDWMQNYRCPDVVVYLPGNPAIDRGAHWQGGPDFLVEIASLGDRSREKLAFYADVGVREVLIVDRDPWKLELYAVSGSPATMRLVGSVAPGDIGELRSAVLPVSFRLQEAAIRPRIRMAMKDASLVGAGRSRTSWSI